MKMKNPLFPRPVAATLWTGMLCCLVTNQPQAQFISFGGLGSTSPSTTFQGEAVAVAGTAAGGFVSVSDTGPLAASGGAQEAAALELSVGGGLSLGASHATIIGGANATSGEALAANVNFVGGSVFGTATTIVADFVMARAAAICASGTVTISAQSELDGLIIDGQAITVTGAADQFVFLSDGGFVIINEQSAGFGTITVNALHIYDLMAGVNVVIGSTTVGITCSSVPPPTTPPPPQPCGFVTGGGWITGTPSGAKANFGVAGGIKNGAFWGHLNYIDHGTGMHVKATAVTNYQVDPTDANCRLIDYDVTIDGQAGIAHVRVCDNGEPGRNDIFQIQLSNGYSAGGDLGGTHPGGGNIQLHKCQ